MLRARRRLSGAKSALLAMAIVAVAGCDISEDFKQALDEFRSAGQQEDTVAETEVEVVAGVDPSATKIEVAAADEADPASQALVRAVQKLLRQMGYEPGPIDGLPGQKTHGAIKAFQADTGTAVDGAVTPALVLALVDASEGGVVSKSGIAPDGAPVPVYSVGDTYVYSDSTTATVVRVDNDVVVWQSGDGERGASHWNFIRPGVTSPFSRPRLRYDVGSAADEIWPLQVGKTVSFSAKPIIAQASVDTDAQPAGQLWQCGVGGAEQVAVAAGRFDTIRITCQTAEPFAGQAVERTWFYAPELRHYVRLDERYAASRPVESVELVAIRLEGVDWPPAARAGLDRALQAALETTPKGKRIEWKSSAVETRVTISPTAERRDAPSYCRTFVQKVRESDGETRIYPGLACREVSGEWVIPGAAPRGAPS